MSEFTSKIRTIEWIDTYSRMVDQTKFPDKFEYVDVKNGKDMFDATAREIRNTYQQLGAGITQIQENIKEASQMAG